MNNFCEKCCRLISDDELELAPLNNNKTIHHYTTTENLYGKNTGLIGYCPVLKHHYCYDSVREPSALEYFLYVTCDINNG